MTLPLSDDPPNGDRGGPGAELTVRATVSGTTVMAFYQVEDTTVLLTSADFGEASAALGGATPEAVAGLLLRELAEAAMACSEVPYLRDDQANPRGE